MTNMTTLDLFCGAGGITEGFRRAGFECLYGNDFSIDAISTFRKNHPRAEGVCDTIEALDPRKVRKSIGLGRGELHCLVGGPPCQGFSINAPIRVLDDPRNSLVRHFLGFVKEFQPRTVLIENVPGMLSLEGGQVLHEILGELKEQGYACAHRILFAAHYGVPQERWRLIILAARTGSAPEHPLPKHDVFARANFTGGRELTFRPPYLHEKTLRPMVTVAEALGDLPVLHSGEGAEMMDYPGPPCSAYSREMRKGSPKVWNHWAPRIAQINLDRLRYIKPGGSWRDIPRDLLPAGMRRARTSDHTKRYGRLRPEGLSGTVMTKMDPHWGAAFHYSQDRTLTVREAARLQSFPDSYVISGPRVSQYEQVGNAVPPLMARAVAESLQRFLLQNSECGERRLRIL